MRVYICAASAKWVDIEGCVPSETVTSYRYRHTRSSSPFFFPRLNHICYTTFWKDSFITKWKVTTNTDSRGLRMLSTVRLSRTALDHFMISMFLCSQRFNFLELKISQSPNAVLFVEKYLEVIQGWSSIIIAQTGCFSLRDIPDSFSNGKFMTWSMSILNPAAVISDLLPVRMYILQNLLNSINICQIRWYTDVIRMTFTSGVLLSELEFPRNQHPPLRSRNQADARKRSLPYITDQAHSLYLSLFALHWVILSSK